MRSIRRHALYVKDSVSVHPRYSDEVKQASCYQDLCDPPTIVDGYRGCGCGDTSWEDLSLCYSEKCLLNTEYYSMYAKLGIL